MDALKSEKEFKLADAVPLLLIDAGTILFSLAAAYYLRFYLNIFAFNISINPDPTAYLILSIAVTPIWLIINAVYGLYSENYLFVGAEEYKRIVNSVTLGTIGLMMLAFLVKKEYARGWVLLAWIVTGILLTTARYLFRHLRQNQRKRGIDVKNVVIIGTNEEGEHLYEKIKKSPYLGFSVAGFIDDNPKNNFDVIGSVHDIEKVIKDKNIQVAILIASALSSDKIQNICSKLSSFGIKTYISPSLLRVISSRIDIQLIADVPLVSVQPVSLSGFKFFAKRVLDIFGALMLLVILFPLFVFIAILIKITSNGPVFFKHERKGRGEKYFMMYKFRTMYKDAENRLAELKHLNEKDGYIFKLKNDPRITKIGKLMRKFSVDEFPQLFNIIKGEMSFVGPRPLPDGDDISDEDKIKYGEWMKQKSQVLPGITGLWQVSGRSELTFEELVKLDIYYIENWSPLFDLYILFRTIPIVLKSKGAY